MAKYEIALQKIENSSKLENLVKIDFFSQKIEFMSKHEISVQKIGNWSELELSQNRFFFSKVEI